MTPYYSDDLVTIYHGDALDVIGSLRDVELVVTDPPYGVGYDLGNDTDAAGNQHKIRAILDMAPGETLLAFGTMDRYPLTAWDYRWSLVWSKPMTRAYPAWGLARHYELIHWFTRGAAYPKPPETMSDVIEASPPLFRTNPENVAHPAQKPSTVLRRLMWGTGTVLDPFMGSGTTLVAAKDMGRRAIGIEIEERYCEIAAQRCSQEVLGLAG